MVGYWKKQEYVEAKLTKAKEGHYVMHMQGEKYPLLGQPRSSLLYGKLSPLKHQIKNKIFNAAWRMLEDNQDPTEHIKSAWQEIFALAEETKYDMLPYEKLSPPIKELHRAMTAVAGGNQNVLKLRDVITFIFQEDDAYRMRFQWMVKFFPWFGKPSINDFAKGLSMLEQAETIGDMKERERLFMRIFLFMVRDSEVFQTFLKEVNWSKIKLTEGDKYHFRAKHFKVDYPEYAY